MSDSEPETETRTSTCAVLGCSRILWNWQLYEPRLCLEHLAHYRPQLLDYLSRLLPPVVSHVQ